MILNVKFLPKLYLIMCKHFYPLAHILPSEFCFILATPLVSLIYFVFARNANI